jgi:hypothetical protein
LVWLGLTDCEELPAASHTTAAIKAPQTSKALTTFGLTLRPTFMRLNRSYLKNHLSRDLNLGGQAHNARQNGYIALAVNIFSGTFDRLWNPRKFAAF